MQRRSPDRREIGQQLRPRPARGVALRHPEVLIETGQGRPVATPEAQRAIGEDALAVGDVRHDLTDRPLARRIGVPRALLGDRAVEGRGRFRLPGEGLPDVAGGTAAM